MKSITSYYYYNITFNWEVVNKRTIKAYAFIYRVEFGFKKAFPSK